MIYAYIRVSTDLQAEKGNSLNEQKQRLAAYCVAMGWEAPNFLIDDGYSAKDMNRPELKTLLQLVQEKKVKKVLVTKLDRISRRLLDLLTLIELFQRHDVSFVSVSESFDTETPAGRLTLQVLGAVAEFERERISERVKDNMISLAINTDKVLFQPCFGYDVVDGHFEINEKEAKYVRMMFEYAEEGHGHRKIAQLLNMEGSVTKRGKPWDQINVKRLMSTETLAGIAIYNKRYKKNGKTVMRDKSEWIVKENNHPAIIDPNRFQEVQNIFQSRSRAHKHADNETYLLTGIIKCKYCDGNMRGSTSRVKRENKRYIYHRYICSSYLLGYGCKHHAIHREPLEEKIIEYVKLFATHSFADSELMISPSKNAKEDIAQLKEQLEKVNKKMQRQIEAFEMELISVEDLKVARNRIDTERKLITDQIEKLNQRNRNVLLLQKQAANLMGDITGIDRIKAKSALRQIIDCVIVEGENVTIIWRG